MTTSLRRRRRVTLAAFAMAVAVLGLVAVLATAGYRELVSSTDGRPAEVDVDSAPTARLPRTATALVGVVDDDGRLTSTVAMVLQPDGTGGTIVVAAASADAGLGATGELVPLDAQLAVAGPEAYVEAAERLTGLSFDVLEIVDADRVTDLLSPLGDLTVVMPFGTVDASSGERWSGGALVVDGAEAARLLTAVDPQVADWHHETARAAVWSAVADRVGAGIGSAQPVASDLALPAITTLDEFVDRLFADRVEARALSFEVVPAERVTEELAGGLVGAFPIGAAVDAVAHDRSELLMVVGATAPARLGAPLEAPRVRVVSGYGDDELDALGLSDAELLHGVLDELVFAQVNVVSVAVLPELDVPETTLVRVADPDLVAGVDDAYRELFGGSDAVTAGVAIEGVDLEIVLGQALLTELGDRSVPAGG